MLTLLPFFLLKKKGLFDEKFFRLRRNKGGQLGRAAVDWNSTNRKSLQIY